ncbi:hypothetical protein MVEN_01753500 [Mycena venus]|uniref:DUF6535 domain-containing protein n=1 Tax=Mycena venus TaxID=2733690 RepID=A0A8H6XMP1_9AGAR|nr:hypothetical protein MVEN_01753500 [Mycena venus]
MVRQSSTRASDLPRPLGLSLHSADIGDRATVDATWNEEDMENTPQNRQEPPFWDDAPHSARSQDMSTHGGVSSPQLHDPLGVQRVPNSGNGGIGGRRPGQSPRNPLPPRRFGLSRGEPGLQGPPNDYRRKYAEDAPYKELDAEARVWLVYNDESAIFDNDMMIESGDNLDILLVFAGLFSSVLTTFVAQTSQALSPDNTAISNSILLELVALQRAQANGTSLDSIPSAATSFAAARTDIWVNGLWFTSLVLSLTTALLAVLAKQWLRQYSSFITGSARERALIRQFRYACFDKWGVQLIIGLLPTVLHLSLLLFMAGLVVFLSSRSFSTALVATCITGFLFGAYIITNVLPVIAIECPYRTPLTALLYSVMYGPGRKLPLRIIIFILLIPYMLVRYAMGSARLLEKPSWLPTVDSGLSSPEHKSLRQAERVYVQRKEKLWIHASLSWLASTTSDPSAKIILIEALGTADLPLDRGPLLPVFAQQWQNTASRFSESGPGTVSDEMMFGRLVRSTLSQAGGYTWEPITTMLHHLPFEPIWVRDHSMILSMAACCRTTKFYWGEDRPAVVLPSYDAFSFVLDHYSVLEEVAVPMWMWLSICVQAVGETLKEIPLSLSSKDRTALGGNPAVGLYDASFILFAVSRDNDTYIERDKISAWLNQRPMPEDLQRAIDQKIDCPDSYDGQHAPVSLAMFLADILSETSFDNYTLWQPALRFAGSSSSEFDGFSSGPSSSPSVDNILADLEHHTVSGRSLLGLPNIASDPLLPKQEDLSRGPGRLILYGHFQASSLTLCFI